MNRSVNRSVHGVCLIHWGNGREWKGMEGNGEKALWLACKSNRHLRNARVRDDLDLQ